MKISAKKIIGVGVVVLLLAGLLFGIGIAVFAAVSVRVTARTKSELKEIEKEG